MVVSHERSGTHFTMNSLAGCFEYVSDPWVNFDHDIFNINFHHPPSVGNVFDFLIEKRCASTIKSHHPVQFLQPVLAGLSDRMDVVYVLRQPVDVMVSCWRLMCTWDWAEGPLTETAAEFAATAPMGRMMRYQWRQQETMVHRWADHAEGWLEAAAAHSHVHVLRYEAMVADYSGTMQALGAEMGLHVRSDRPPSRSHSWVTKGSRPFNPPPGADDKDAVRAVVSALLGDRLEALGYG